ncbi:MAG: restriction endonuclease [Alphaproteobacteria bacterium]
MSIIFHGDIAGWRDLQNKACQVLAECGMAAQTDVPFKLVRGNADIDVVANDETSTPPLKIFVECKHWKSNVTQEKAHAFRTVMQDGGANAGFIISSSGFQSGAYEAIHSTNIRLMTWPEFQEHFYDRWLKSMKIKVGELSEPVNIYSDPFGRIMRGLDGTEERVKIAEKLWEKYKIFMSASPYLNMEVNGRSNTPIRFPMTCVDPRGNVDQQDQITIETPRDYFDLIISEHENALRAFQKFTSELSEGTA